MVDEDEIIDGNEQNDIDITKTKVVPFRIDAFSFQYGDIKNGVLPKDAKEVIKLVEGDKIEMKIEQDQLEMFGDGSIENAPISLFLSGIRKGFLPTLKFIVEKYKNVVIDEKGTKGNAQKIYYSENFDSSSKIKKEFDDIVKQIGKYDLDYNDIILTVPDGKDGKYEKHTVNFYKFNYGKIEAIRDRFGEDGKPSINITLSSVVTKKSAGRGIAGKNKSVKDLLIKDKRLKIHAVNRGAVSTTEPYDNKDINLKATKILAVIRIPNANKGRSNIYPVTIKSLDKSKIDTLHYMFDLFDKATKSKKVLEELDLIMIKSGFVSTDGILNNFNKFVTTYFTSINDSTTKPKVGIPTLSYFKSNTKKGVHDFVINYVSTTGSIESVKLKNNKELFLSLVKQTFGNKLFALDVNKLNDFKNSNYPVLRNDKIEFDNQSYYDYIGNQLETTLEQGEENKVDGKYVYVKDFLVNLSDDFVAEKNAPVVKKDAEPKVQEPIIQRTTGRTVPTRKRTTTSLITPNPVSTNIVISADIAKDEIKWKQYIVQLSSSENTKDLANALQQIDMNLIFDYQQLIEDIKIAIDTKDTSDILKKNCDGDYGLGY
jgi:hypothetical protein